MDTQVLDWLLEEANPSIRCRTLTELLDQAPDSPEVRSAQAKIADSKPVARIFSKLNGEGYWDYKGRGRDALYVDYYTTHFNLAFLAELGMTRGDARIARAVEYYLAFQKPDGDFYKHFSCLYGYNLRTLILLGYRDDPRLRKIADLMISTTRPDGGYLCDLHEGKYKTKVVKSCVRGSAKVLLGFAMLPELWESARCQQLVSYFLERRLYFRKTPPEQPINWEITAALFPITWRSSFLEILYALSLMGYGQHPALDSAWALLETKRDEHGRYRLDWTPTASYFTPGKRGEPNKWITLYAYLSLKQREEMRAAA